MQQKTEVSKTSFYYCGGVGPKAGTRRANLEQLDAEKERTAEHDGRAVVWLELRLQGHTIDRSESRDKYRGIVVVCCPAACACLFRWLCS